MRRLPGWSAWGASGWVIGPGTMRLWGPGAESAGTGAGQLGIAVVAAWLAGLGVGRGRTATPGMGPERHQRGGYYRHQAVVLAVPARRIYAGRRRVGGAPLRMEAHSPLRGAPCGMRNDRAPGRVSVLGGGGSARQRGRGLRQPCPGRSSRGRARRRVRGDEAPIMSSIPPPGRVTLVSPQPFDGEESSVHRRRPPRAGRTPGFRFSLRRPVRFATLTKRMCSVGRRVKRRPPLRDDKGKRTAPADRRKPLRHPAGAVPGPASDVTRYPRVPEDHFARRAGCGQGNPPLFRRGKLSGKAHLASSSGVPIVRIEGADARGAVPQYETAVTAR